MEILPFSVAGGSVPGTEHTKPGQPGWVNNQDAFAFGRARDVLVAVVCDGCGSMPQSDVGARLSAQFIAKELPRIAFALPAETALAMLGNKLVAFIERTARDMGDDVPNIVGNNFLFTVIGALLTPEYTVIFEAGDGVYAINGRVEVIPPYAGNAPPYLGHRLTGWFDNRELLKFRIRETVSTDKVDSILIGSDGVADAVALEKHPLPNPHSERTFGPLSQFWEDDLYVRNSDAIRRRLALANLESVEEGRIRKGLLPDDTTIVVVRRLLKEGGA